VIIFVLLCVVVVGCRANDDNATSEYNPTDGIQPITEDVSGSDYLPKIPPTNYPKKLAVSINDI